VLHESFEQGPFARRQRQQPALAARPVTLTTTLKNYRGPGAYLVLYVTDANGAYKGTLWMAGGKSKYYKHPGSRFRATGGDPAQISGIKISGITGASVGAGRTQELSFDLSDALFDAGCRLHIDAVAEDLRDSPNDVVIPLTGANAGKPVAGRRCVASFTFR